MRALLPVLLLSACKFSAAGTTVDDSADSPSTTDDSPDPGDSAAPDDSEEPPDPLTVDDDGDGLSEEAGDCDDGDPTIHPGATDRCGRGDEDCDGELDEDASMDDSYEPNDVAATDLGALEDEPQQELTASLHNNQDVDRFGFSLTDYWYDDFKLTATLTNIPTDATYRLTLLRVRSDGEEALGTIDQVFGSGSVSIVFEDAAGIEDGGDYEVLVEAIAGADCGSSYLLTLLRQ